MEKNDGERSPSTHSITKDVASLADSNVIEGGSWDKAAYRRAVFKMDLIVVPLVTITYFLSFLDRTNIGNAKVAGLQKDLKLTNHQFSVALTCTYVLFIASEVPMNLVMKRVGATITIPTMTALWGMVCALQGVVNNYHGLIAIRLFLGLCEGGLLPGLVLYMSFFYRRHDLASRLSLMLAMTALAGAFSGLLASAISSLHNTHGRPGWAWIFIIEGTITAAFGLFLFVAMPKSPGTTPFLTNAEVVAVEQALKEDWADEKKGEKFSWEQVKLAFTSPHLWIFSPAMLFNGVTLFGLAFFAPSIVGALGHSPNRTQLLVVPPYACAFVVAVLSSIVSDKLKNRGITMISIAAVAVAGYALFLADSNKHHDYGALYLQVVGAYATAPSVAAWQANNYLPYYRRATAVGWGFVMTNTGGIISTWIFTDPPRYKKATRINLIMSVGIMVFSLINTLYLRSQNAKKRAMSVEDKRQFDSEESRQLLGDRHPDFFYTP